MLLCKSFNVILTPLISQGFLQENGNIVQDPKRSVEEIANAACIIAILSKCFSSFLNPEDSSKTVNSVLDKCKMIASR